MSTTPLLFPSPAVPPHSHSEVQMACTAGALQHRQLSSALQRGGWSEEGVAEMARLIAAARSTHEALLALLQPPKGGGR